MAKPNLPDPAAAAQKVKDLARDLAADVTDTYRKSNRFLRMRVGIVGGWGLLALLSLLVAFHTSERDDRIRLEETSVGSVVWVNNTSDENWTDVTITIEGGWKLAIPTVRHGETISPTLPKFTKDGVSAPADLSPRWIELECDQVSKKFDVSRH